MTSDFFSELRRLAGLGREVQQLKEHVLHPQKDAPCADGAAVLFLRGLQNDLKQLKVDGGQHLSRLCDDQGFKKVVPMCEALLQHQAAEVVAVEDHLSHYGYIPLERPDQKKTADASGDTTQKEQSTSEENNTSGSPSSRGSRPPVDLDHTPTLEDFGLSEDTVSALLDKKHVFKAPTMDLKPKITSAKVPLHKWPSNESIPEQFKNENGIALTPGFFNGRHISAATPSEHLGTRPVYYDLSPTAATPRETLLHRLENTEVITGRYGSAGSNIEPSSPEPPVLRTPGIRKFLHPTYTQQKQPPLSGPQFSDDDDSEAGGHAKNLTRADSSQENSPAFPVFQTPGLNKIQKCLTRPEESSQENTPDLPEFQTPYLKERFRAQTAATTVSLTQKDSPEEIPESPELTSRNFWYDSCSSMQDTKGAQHPTVSHMACLPIPTTASVPAATISRTEPITKGPTSRVSQLLLSDDDQEMPCTPETTFNFKGLSRIAQQQAPVPTGNQPTEPRTGDMHEFSAMPVAPVLSSAASNDDDDDLPPEPVVTSNYSKWAVRVGGDGDGLATKNVTAVTGTASTHRHDDTSTRLDDVKQTTIIKEKREKDFIGDQAASNELLFPPGVKSVSALSADEYVEQPDWFQRQMSMDMVEDAVKIINMILRQKHKNGESLTIEEQELMNELGTKAKPLACILVNTGRLTISRVISSGATYVVA